MGVDLKLLPLYHKTASFSTQVIMLERNYALFNAIETKVKEVGKGLVNPISAYVAYDEQGNTCYGELTYDAFGKRLTYLLAKDLKQVFLGFEFAENSESDSWENRAAKAFVNELPNDLPVYLYWH